MPTDSLKNKVVAITGGASGIGFSCANLFAAQGAKIVIADISVQTGEKALSQLKNTHRCEAIFKPVDVTQEDQVIQLGNKTMEAFGRIDVVIAAAGISDPSSKKDPNKPINPLANHLINKPLTDWKKILDINLTGVMLTDRVFARHMIEHNIAGSIINIASIAAKFPFPGSSDYCVSKAGVAMLTKVLAMELVDHNIRVNAIAPGFIETPLTTNLQTQPEGKQLVMTMTPMQRFGKPEEIANTALFLATDQSSFFTGEVLFPTGGIFTG